MTNILRWTIGLSIVCVIIWILLKIFVKPYEFSESEEEDLRLLDIMQKCNTSDLLFRNISEEKFKENNKELLNTLDRIEKAHRKDKRKK